MEYILASVIVFIFLFLFVFSTESIKQKGEIGEKLVKRKLKKIWGYKKVFNNMLLCINNKSVQIDHILISKGGIFVIETKNYLGSIYGTENGVNWTQVVGKYKNSFYNPIRQNETHIKFLKEHLKNSLHYHSIIVFAGKEKLHTKTKTPTISLISLKRHISYKNKKVNMTKKEIKLVSEQLKKLQKENKITLQNHIKKLKDGKF